MHVGGVKRFLPTMLHPYQGIGLNAADLGLPLNDPDLEAVRPRSVEGGFEQGWFQSVAGFVHYF